MRNAFAEALYREAVRDENIYVVVADISPAGSMAKFREEYPERFINVGVAEQAMIGVAAGLALKGKRVFCYTIATFALYRAFEFIRNDLCYQDLPVTVVGMGAGLSYPDHGGTHQAIEDIAIASALPNMQVIAPCDPSEVERAVEWCARESRHPTYLRLGKSGEPRLDYADWQFGQPRQLWTGSLMAILSYGPIINLAIEVAGRLRDRPAVFSCHTLKPFPVSLYGRLLRDYDRILVIEEHVPSGGLSTRIKELCCDVWRELPTSLDCFTLKDAFIHSNGRRDDMLAAHGLTVENILAAL